MQPYERLRDELQWVRDVHEVTDLNGNVACRSRGGVRFDHAWRQALARVCRDLPDGEWWRSTFQTQETAWRRAYDRTDPTNWEAEFARLIVELGLATVHERRCGFCGASLEGRRPNVRFCGPDHRRKAEWRREKLAMAG
jgi:hypothetical protein